MDTDLLKSRVKFAVKLTKFLYNFINSKVNLGELQSRYHADKGRITRVDLQDINISIYFRVKDGRLELLKGVKPKSVDNVVTAVSDVYFSIFDKEYDELVREVVNRWRYGELSMNGPSALSDFKLFIKAAGELQELKNELRLEQQPN